MGTSRQVPKIRKGLDSFVLIIPLKRPCGRDEKLDPGNGKKGVKNRHTARNGVTWIQNRSSDPVVHFCSRGAQTGRYPKYVKHFKILFLLYPCRGNITKTKTGPRDLNKGC